MIRPLLLACCLLLVSCSKKSKDEPPEAATKNRETTSPPAPRYARPAIFGAQGWYPGNPAALRTDLTQLLATAKSAGACKADAIVAPHAGYRFSGPMAAAAFKSLEGRHPGRVIVLGLAHRRPLQGISLGNYTHYETPLGDLPVDRRAARHLLDGDPDIFKFAPLVHETEHSAEMELPFIRHLFGPVPTLIVLVGHLSEAETKKATQVISGIINEKTLLIASSDFTHRGPRYRFTPFASSTNIKADLKKLDMGAFEQIALLDRRALNRYKRQTGITMCGIRPVGLLMDLMLTAGGPYRVDLRDYGTSATALSDWRNTVSYLGISFCRQEKDLYRGLDALDKKTLHIIVKRVLKAVTAPGFNIAEFNPADYIEGLHVKGMLSEEKAPFVTLKKNGRLRGCIGYLRPHGKLWEAVAKNTLSAALRDRRFSPVTASEVPGLHREISILSLPRAVQSHKDVVIGKHGIILRKGRRRATFLPQVAVEQRWDRDTTLRRLAQKAGLPPDAYTLAAYEVYTAQVF